MVGVLGLATSACPGGDDGSAETGSLPTGTATGGTASSGPADGTADASGSGGPAAAECNYDVAEWVFDTTIEAPRTRGLGSGVTCNPVTTDTIALEVQVVVPEGIVLSPSGSVRVLLFEANPLFADAQADCIGGLCESLDGASLAWSFEVPNDLPDFTYYIVVDIDADGPDIDGCTLRETDLVTFVPGQGPLVVPMTADGCV